MTSLKCLFNLQQFYDSVKEMHYCVLVYHIHLSLRKTKFTLLQEQSIHSNKRLDLSTREMEDKYFCLNRQEKKEALFSEMNSTEAWLRFVFPTEAAQLNNGRDSYSFTPKLDLNQIYTPISRFTFEAQAVV